MAFGKAASICHFVFNVSTVNMSETPMSAATRHTLTSRVSYLITPDRQVGKAVLRSKWKEGRRFELARLLGDELLNAEGSLFPATRAHTYRQNAQRSFAAELLSPFAAVFNMLQGDYSDEKPLDVAGYFKVSVITIRTQLVNHGILDRDYLDADTDRWSIAA